MAIEEILVANGAAVVILAILFISRLLTKRNFHTEDHVFTALIITGIICATLETLSFLMDGKGGEVLRVFNIICNSVLFSCNACISLIWVYYVDLVTNRGGKRNKLLYIPMIAISSSLIVGVIFNAFFGFFFIVDANNVYARAPAGYIFYVYLLCSFAISIVLYVRARLKYGQSLFFPIWMFLTPVMAACAIQAIWYGISLAWLGCAIGLVGIHVNLQSRILHIDGLTGLYNRAYVEHKLILARYSPKYVYSGIMLDIDYFKEINDTYGHSVGDRALIDAANILMKSVDRDSMAFRFAGDEFIILVRVLTNKKEELEAKTIEVKERVRSLAESFNKSNKTPYKIVFSMGHSFYFTNYDDDVFFHNMDREMYKEKQQHHIEHKDS